MVEWPVEDRSFLKCLGTKGEASESFMKMALQSHGGKGDDFL